MFQMALPSTPGNNLYSHPVDITSPRCKSHNGGLLQPHYASIQQWRLAPAPLCPYSTNLFHCYPKHFTFDTTFAFALPKMPLLTADALKLATSRGHLLHSDLDDVKFPSTEDNIKKLLKSLASKGSRSIWNDIVFNNPEVSFVYLTEEHKIGVFHSHTMVIPKGGNADNLQLVGLLSDRINSNIAARHDGENPLDGFVVSIARIRENSFVALENVTPDAVHKPNGTSTNSNAELGFPEAMDDDLPAFVLLPKMMLVPLGYSLPISAKISDGVPPLLQARHGGPPSFFGWKRCTTFSSIMLLTWYNKTKLTVEELAASGSPLPAAGNPGSPFDLTKELISHLSSATKSAKDRSNEDLIQNSIHSWQLVGSREDTQDGTNALMVIPGSINPTFALIHKETNKRIRGTKLASALHFHIEQQRKEGTLAAMASKWTKEQFDVDEGAIRCPFCKCDCRIYGTQRLHCLGVILLSVQDYRILLLGCVGYQLPLPEARHWGTVCQSPGSPWRIGSKQSPEDGGVVCHGGAEVHR
ncbi:hypothetical protein IV203_032409 [Nitzschia inconspicua]|uniref:Uncharacterized protein n=1 Tax=Nitzschia inconspicua TaxID=303405 RepID=A0A9K3PEY4_9STRA|nr:hypothetical protein IV203_032409 [Nitzschia inconspicua]